MPERNKKAQTGRFYAEKTLWDEEPLAYTQQSGPTQGELRPGWLIFGEGEGRKVHRKEEIGIKS